MKLVDTILSFACGLFFGFLVGDFLAGANIHPGFWLLAGLWIGLALIAVICLQIAYLIAKRLPFVFEGAKFLLVGEFATIVDLKVFEILVWLLGATIPIASTVAKTISFIVATLLKFWGNKHWTFQKHEKESMRKEIIQFFGITLVGLLIDLIAFHYFSGILGPQFGIPLVVWTKLSVIFAGVTAALWNFLGYKFFVFKTKKPSVTHSA